MTKWRLLLFALKFSPHPIINKLSGPTPIIGLKIWLSDPAKVIGPKLVIGIDYQTFNYDISVKKDNIWGLLTSEDACNLLLVVSLLLLTSLLLLLVLADVAAHDAPFSALPLTLLLAMLLLPF
jgi:hypothetical protein